MKRKILVATTNVGKIAELKAMLDLDADWLDLSYYPEVEEIEEDGETFIENACKKATEYARITGQWTIADDSGLQVDALGGEPGVKSARYSGEKTINDDGTLIDHRNIEKVIKLLEGIPNEKRTARFFCSLCLATPDHILIETEGTLEGLITKKEIGKNGFGYDPIFFLPSLNKTVAQLTQEEKNSISHRGKAIKSLKQKINDLT